MKVELNREEAELVKELLLDAIFDAYFEKEKVAEGEKLKDVKEKYIKFGLVLKTIQPI